MQSRLGDILAKRSAAMAVALALLPFALALGGCTPKLFRAKPPPTETFGPTVDAVVIPPFQVAKDVAINAIDQRTLRELLEAEMKAKPGIRIFPKPPTALPNTATIEASLLLYQVKEQTGDGLILRTVNLAALVNARIGNENDPSIKFQRAVSYQKIYGQGQTVATVEFDFHNAARELAAMVAESLLPSEPKGLTLVRAVDQASGEDWSLPALNKAIGYAQNRRDADALRMWSLVLFNPETQDERDLYRVSERTLAWLRDRGLDDDTLSKLSPLTRLKPLELVAFREEVRRALDGTNPLESTVLQLSDTHADHVHLNLYAAHLDMYRMYLRDKRLDLASYHLSRAYAHYPMNELLDAWIKLQTGRNLIPPGVQPGTMFWMYLRIPAPRTALVTAGAFDMAVLPPPAIEDQLDALPPLAVPRRAAPGPGGVPPSRLPRSPSGSQPASRPAR